MGKTSKQTSNQTSTSTTTPINPSWVEPGIEAMFGNIGELGKRDPASFIPGASTLQQLAFGQAPGLAGAGSDYNIMANAYGQRAADWQPAMVTAANAQAPGAMNVAGAKASLGNLGMTDLATAGSATAQQTGPAAQYTAAQIDPNKVSLADRPEITSERISGLMSPYMSQVMEGLQRQLDYSSSKARQAYEKKSAASGAFGGSSYGLGRSDLEGQLARENGATTANALQTGYNTSLQAALAELGLQADTGKFNAGSKNAAQTVNVGALNDAGQFNAGQTNDLSKANAQLGTQAEIANAGNRTQTSVANSGLLGDLAKMNAQLGTQVSLANAGAENDASRLQYSTLADLAQSNAAGQNRAGEVNAGAYNAGADRALQAAGLFGDLSNSAADNARKNTALIGDLGTQQRAIDGEQAMAPLTIQQLLAQTMGQLPLNLLRGETTNGTQTGTTTSKESNPMGALGTLAMLAAAPLTGGLSLGGLAGAAAGGGSLLSSLGGIAGAVKAGAGLGTALKAGAGLASVGGFRAGLGR
jgi:hypothetical protein